MKLLKYFNFKFSSSLLPLLILIIGFLVTYIAFNVAETQLHQKKINYFNFRVREAASLINNRMQAYEQVLRGADGLFTASKNVDRDEFRNYITQLNLAHYYPGIQGVGFSLIVPNEKKAAHIAYQRSKGFPEYTIRPEGKRDVYTSIIYLEPFSGRNLQAFGYDMFSEPVRRAAMQKAIDSGKLTLSGKVRLVQETDKDRQVGFLMYLPIYLNGSTPDNIIKRRENIVGWVYAPFRMKDLMDGLFGEHANDLDIHIFNGRSMSKENLMFDSNLPNRPNNQLSKTVEIEIADHFWTVHIQSLPLIDERVESNLPYLIALIGSVISVMLSLLIWFLITGRTRAINFAKKMNTRLMNKRKRLTNIIEGTQVGTWEWNVQNGQLILNERWAEIIGYTLSELEPVSIDTWLKFLHPNDLTISTTALEKHFSGEVRYYECEVRMKHKDGNWIYVLSRGKVSKWSGSGKPLMMFGTHQDITYRKQAENELKIAATVFESEVGMYVTDNQSVILRVNNAFTKITGYEEDEVIGSKASKMNSSEQDKESYVSMWESINTNGTWEGEIWNKRKNGDIFPAHLNITVIKNANNEVINYVYTILDNTEQNRLETELKRQAHLDYLTELSNRRHFIKQGEVELSRAIRYGNPLSLMLLDIDFFKSINDTYGHNVGDLAIQSLSKVCKDTMRQVDIIGRLGGEEFAIILPETSSKKAVEVAERLREAVANTKVTPPVGLPIQFTVSIGVTSLDQKDANIDMLLDQADKAMYQAKKTGRNKVCVG